MRDALLRNKLLFWIKLHRYGKFARWDKDIQSLPWKYQSYVDLGSRNHLVEFTYYFSSLTWVSIETFLCSRFFPPSQINFWPFQYVSWSQHLIYRPLRSDYQYINCFMMLSSIFNTDLGALSFHLNWTILCFHLQGRI